MFGHFKLFKISAVINLFVQHRISTAISSCQVRINFNGPVKIPEGPGSFPVFFMSQAAQVEGACILRIEPDRARKIG